MDNDSLVLAVSGGRSSVTSDVTDFWSIARSHHSQLLQPHSLPVAAAVLAQMAQLAATQPTPEVLARMWAGIASHDAVLSNLKEAQLGPVYGGSTVAAVYGPAVLWGGESEQTVGAVTFDGRLRLVHSSYKPLPGLLNSMRQMVEEAVRGTAPC